MIKTTKGNDRPLAPPAMLAWICPAYGPPSVLQLAEQPPPALANDMVLIRVLATTVSSGDARVRGCRFPPGLELPGRLALGWSGPRKPVLGIEAAGVVVACGNGVSRFKPGDRVIAFPDIRMGAHAEYLTMKDSGLIAPWPLCIARDHAASLCFGGLTARHYLTRARIGAGQRLLVIGGSGTVGSALIQLARIAGARVTATCSPANVAMVRDLGAAAVVDYTATDIAASGEQWDVIADCAATLDFPRALPLLRDGGRYIAIAGGWRELLGRNRQGKQLLAGPSSSRQEDLDALIALAATRDFLPLIDSCLGFQDVPAAHARVDGGRKRGSIVIHVDEML